MLTISGPTSKPSPGPSSIHHKTSSAKQVPVKSACESDQTKLYWNRWAILAIFCSLSMSNSFQWIEYAIISNIFAKYYGVSETAIHWTSMIYMLTYLVFVFPATWILDKYGLRLTAFLGSCGNCVGALIKCASAAPDRFWVTFVGQTMVGTSQIFTLGLPPRLAAIWFGPKEVSTACALGVLGEQLGIAIGCLVPPMIVRNIGLVTETNATIEDSCVQPNNNENLTTNDSRVFYDNVTHDLYVLFIGSAVVNTTVFVLVLAFFEDKPKIPPSKAQLSSLEASIEKNYLKSLKQLCLNRNFIFLVISYGINTGAFYAVTTLLNQVLTKYYMCEEENIGRIGLTIILAGMTGTLAIGVWLDRTKLYRATIRTVYFLSFSGMVLYTGLIHVYHLWVMFIVAAFLGFFMTSYFALGFEVAIELTYPTSEGTTSGLLNASAQVFGLVMTSVMDELIETVNDIACNVTLSACLLLGAIITTLIKADLRRQLTETKSTLAKSENRITLLP